MNSANLKYRISFRSSLSVIAALVMAATMGLSTQAAAAKAPKMDEEVLRWFDSHAMEEVNRISSERIVLGGDGSAAPMLEKPQFGAIFPVHIWTAEFIAGAKEAEPTRAIEQWVAPLFAEGKPAGTIVAWRDPMLDGAVALAYFDDDIEAGAALAELADDTHLIFDAPLSSYFVMEKGNIRALTSMGRLDIEKATPIAAYQTLLVRRYAIDKSWGPEDDYAGGGAMIPSSAIRADLMTNRIQFAGAAIALAGILLFGIDALRRRRDA